MQKNMIDGMAAAQSTAAVSTLYQQRRIRIPKRGPLFEYPSPDTAQPMGVDQFALSIDPVALRALASSFTARGLTIFAGLMSILAGAVPFIFVLQRVLKNGFGDDDLIYFAVPGIGSILLLLLGFYAIVWDVCKPYVYPLLFNRRSARIVQMQGSKRVEAKWSDLVPFIERAGTASAAGAGTVFHLHLVKLSMGGSTAELDFLVRISLASPQACAMAYEYIKCYMQGDLRQLPETTLIPSIRRPFLKEFRNGMVAGIFNDVPWAKRSLLHKLATFTLLPALVTMVFPMVALNLLGSRLGWIPQFPPDVLNDAAYDPARDGSLPVELAARIHPEPPLDSTEKLFYIVVLVVATAVWTWFTGFLIHSFA